MRWLRGRGLLEQREKVDVILGALMAAASAEVGMKRRGDVFRLGEERPSLVGELLLGGLAARVAEGARKAELRTCEGWGVDGPEGWGVDGPEGRCVENVGCGAGAGAVAAGRGLGRNWL